LKLCHNTFSIPSQVSAVLLRSGSPGVAKHFAAKGLHGGRIGKIETSANQNVEDTVAPKTFHFPEETIAVRTEQAPDQTGTMAVISSETSADWLAAAQIADVVLEGVDDIPKGRGQIEEILETFTAGFFCGHRRPQRSADVVP
jgi:hypothetical protein